MESEITTIRIDTILIRGKDVDFSRQPDLSPEMIRNTLAGGLSIRLRKRARRARSRRSLPI